MSLKNVVLGAFAATLLAGVAVSEAKDAATCEAHVKAVEARLTELKDSKAGEEALKKAKEHQASGDFEGCVEALKASAEELKI